MEENSVYCCIRICPKDAEVTVSSSVCPTSVSLWITIGWAYAIKRPSDGCEPGLEADYLHDGCLVDVFGNPSISCQFQR